LALIFECDENKAVSNTIKHGVAFTKAGTIFRDEQSITISDLTKKPKAKKETMLAEYDFSAGIKGKYAKLCKQETNLILLEPDVVRSSLGA